MHLEKLKPTKEYDMIMNKRGEAMATPKDIDRELARSLIHLKLVKAGKLNIDTAIKMAEAEATAELVAYINEKVDEAP